MYYTTLPSPLNAKMNSLADQKEYLTKLKALLGDSPMSVEDDGILEKYIGLVELSVSVLEKECLDLIAENKLSLPPKIVPYDYFKETLGIHPKNEWDGLGRGFGPYTKGKRLDPSDVPNLTRGTVLLAEGAKDGVTVRNALIVTEIRTIGDEINGFNANWCTQPTPYGFNVSIYNNEFMDYRLDGSVYYYAELP